MSLVRMLSTRPSTKMSALLTDSADILVHAHLTINGYYYSLSLFHLQIQLKHSLLHTVKVHGAMCA